MTRPETDARRAYRLLVEHMTEQAGQYDDEHDDDEYDDVYDDDEYDDDEYDDGEYESSDYSAGYQDGWNAHAAHMRLSYRLKNFFLPYSVRSKYYALRRRLFPNDSDIPF